MAGFQDGGSVFGAGMHAGNPNQSRWIDNSTSEPGSFRVAMRDLGYSRRIHPAVIRSTSLRIGGQKGSVMEVQPASCLHPCTIPHNAPTPRLAAMNPAPAAPAKSTIGAASINTPPPHETRCARMTPAEAFDSICVNSCSFVANPSTSPVHNSAQRQHPEVGRMTHANRQGRPSPPSYNKTSADAYAELPAKTYAAL